MKKQERRSRIQGIENWELRIRVGSSQLQTEDRKLKTANSSQLITLTDIWFVIKTNGEWLQPQNMGEPVYSEKDGFYPSVTKHGDIYFTRAVEGREEDPDKKYFFFTGNRQEIKTSFDKQ